MCQGPRRRNILNPLLVSPLAASNLSRNIVNPHKPHRRPPAFWSLGSYLTKLNILPTGGSGSVPLKFLQETLQFHFNF